MSSTNLVYDLPHDSPLDRRLRVLGNLRKTLKIKNTRIILEKSQISVETLPSAQSPFYKLNFNNGGQKVCKSRYYSFLVLFSFTGFFYFIPNI